MWSITKLVGSYDFLSIISTQTNLLFKTMKLYKWELSLYNEYGITIYRELQPNKSQVLIYTRKMDETLNQSHHYMDSFEVSGGTKMVVCAIPHSLPYIC